MRNLPKSKFMQTLGRISRIESEDRGVLEGDRNTPLYKLNKPYAYVILPVFTGGNEDKNEEISRIVKELRTNSYLNWEEMISTEIITGIGEEDAPELLNAQNDNKFKGGKEIEAELLTELEGEQIASLTIMDGMSYEMAKEYYESIGVEIDAIEKKLENERIFSMSEEDFFNDQISDI